MSNRELLLLLLFLMFPLPAQAQTQKDSSQFLNHVEKQSAVPARVDLYRADSLLTRAYHDVFEMLSTANKCSDFYGGPDRAIFVLNKFVLRITKSQLPKDISFVMTGPVVSINFQGSDMPYRLFERTIINTRGSFYQTKAFESQPSIPPVGSFPAGTRSARALILLHELGHLIQGPNHVWVLRDDGMKSNLSRLNTELVQQACRQKLDLLN
jgi:hypothetical protein